MIKSFSQHFFRSYLSRKNIGFLAVLLVSILFILIRLLMPIKFDGSFIDEYWHITNGLSLFESGHYAHFYNDGKDYVRGLSMSLWVGLWVTLFGKSILVAKLAPISIGIINYFLFLYLTTKLFAERRFQLLLLVLYTLSPWVIFNHFYIRFYIMNELLLLILLVLGFQLYRAVRDEKWGKSFLFLSLVILVNLYSLVAIKDPSENLLLLASGVMLSSLFIYEFKVEAQKINNIPGVVLGSIFFSSAVYRAILVLLIAVLGLIVLDVGSKLDFLLHGQIKYTSPEARKYTWLFWENNWLISVFFVMAVATFWWKNTGFERIILLVAGTLFFIHTIASEDLQIIRGILYFLPLYYIAAVIGVSKLFRLTNISGRLKWAGYIIFGCIFLILTLTNVEKSFYWGPRIKREVNYIEYERLYDTVTNNCQNKLIVEASPSSPFVANFYGVNVDYVLSTAINVDDDPLFLVDAVTGKYNTAWGAAPVITDIKDLGSLDKDICLVVRRPSMEKYLPAAVEEMFQNVDQSWHFHNMDLYSIEQEALKGVGK